MKKTEVWPARGRLLRRAREKLEGMNDSLRAVLEAVGRFLFGFLLGRVSLPGGIAPLGGAFVAACGDGGHGAAAAAGVMLGSAAGYGLAGGLRGAASALLIYSALFLLREWKLTARPFFAPLTAAFMTGLIGAVYLRYEGAGGPGLILWAAEWLLAGGLCLLFRAGMKREGGSALGAVLLAMALCMALGDLKIAGVISIGRTAAACAVLTAAWLGRASAGALAGLLLGIALDLAGGTPGVCTLAMGCAGALGGAASGRSRLLCALGCILGNAAAAFWGAGSEVRTGLLYEFFIASVLFLLPTEGFFENLRRRQEPQGPGGLLHYVQGRVALAARAMEELGTLLRDTPEEGRGEDPFGVFDVAAQEVCRPCPRRETCWGREYETTRGALLEARESIRQRGSARPEDLPLWFRDACLNVRDLTDAVSREWKAAALRRQMRARLREDRDLLDRQYADFAAVLRDLAAHSAAREETALTARLRLFLRDYAPGVAPSAFRDVGGRLHVELAGPGKGALLRKEGWLDSLSQAAGTELLCPDEGGKRLKLYEREPLEAEVGVAACCKGGKAPSGDVARSFKTAEGVLYIVVADGMGSGPEAASESAGAADLAEMLLRAGIEPETALRTLNTALILRGEKRLSALCFDLMSVNLFTGEACVYKYGAAPSYVRSGREVRALKGETAAAGTEDVGPDCTRLYLESGSAAVILSDGAARAENVAERLRTCAPEGLQALASAILSEAAAQGGWEDDMTVLTLSLRKREEPGIA